MGSNRLRFARLGLAVFCFAIASMVVLPAPTVWLWKVTLLATEFGHWVVLLPLLLLIFRGRKSRAGLVATGLAMVSVALLLSSAVRAWWGAERVAQELAVAFPGGEIGEPFAWRELWLGRDTAPVPVQTLEYARHEGVALQLDFYHAQSTQPAPCVIVLHTGGWDGGTRREFEEFDRRCARRGYAVASVEYRLAPRWQWPAQREDVRDAIRYLQNRAAELGIAPQKFVLLGRSAGGQIAEAVACGEGDAICGVVAFYAPADMDFAYGYARSDDILNSFQLLRQYLGGSPAEQPAAYASASGYSLVSHRSPPTLLLHGQRDELVWHRQSERLSVRLAEHGVPYFFLQPEWATHAFDFNPHGPGGQLANYAVAHFLDAVTRK